MIKLIIFDLDGVLVDTEEIHYSALLRAIRESTSLSDFDIITLIKKDGSSTAEKLKLLKKYYNINDVILKEIDKLKQSYSLEMLQYVKMSKDIIDTIKELHKNYLITVVSNSRLSNVNLILDNTNLKNIFYSIITPGDVYAPKPSADMYVDTMRICRCDPHETLILEDSPSGIEAGIRSEAYVMSINSITDTNLQNINYVINQITNDNCSYGGKRKQIYSSRIP